MAKVLNLVLLHLALAVFSALLTCAQTTEFNFQGNLLTAGVPAAGNHDFEFALFDSLAGGTQVGATLTRSNVAVANGIFSVQLNFGSQFPGAARFLEIRVRVAGQPGITTLAPRQQIASQPYSVKSLNAENATNSATATTATNAIQLGGIGANQYVLTGDGRLSDARTPTAGSTNYVQNTTNPQAASNFNISGGGTAAGTLSGGVVNAATQYNIGGSRVLSNAGTDNIFAGVDAGQANTTGFNNSFFGERAGYNNTTGYYNSFFGKRAGESNTTGHANSFSGRSAGDNNTTGSNNSFFGYAAGYQNTTGFSNSFVGVQSGDTNTLGSNNTLLGSGADVGSNNLTYAGAFGSNARVDQSNSIVLGAINGVNTATADTNVGIGTTAPSNTLHIVANGGNLVLGNPGCDPGFAAIGFSSTLAGCNNYAILGNATQTVISRPTGGVIEFREGNSIQASIGVGGGFSINGILTLNSLGSAGATTLCRNASNQISTCSSSLRYKTNISRFTTGLDLINRLKPITFDWKDGGMHDLGLGAEDVAAIEPLLVTYNKDGQVEGVKYDRIGVVLINAIKEQQAQIEAQQAKIATLERQKVLQQQQIELLMKLVCFGKAAPKACKTVLVPK